MGGGAEGQGRKGEREWDVGAGVSNRLSSRPEGRRTVAEGSVRGFGTGAVFWSRAEIPPLAHSSLGRDDRKGRHFTRSVGMTGGAGGQGKGEREQKGLH